MKNFMRKCLLSKGILYREYNDAKQSWENDRNKLLQQKTEAEEASKQLEAKSTHLLVTGPIVYILVCSRSNLWYNMLTATLVNSGTH